MHQFGFKIVDQDTASMAPVLEYAITHGRPIEIGFYFADPAALDLLRARLGNADVHVNAHSNQTRVNANNLHKTEDLLAKHVAKAQSVGSHYSILHLANTPNTMREALRPVLFARLLDNLERAESLCTRLDYRLHLENDFHPVDFYRRLFDGIHARGLRRMHFCFDIGHAKVWSNDTLDEWLAFMGELEQYGFALHCHLHANAGFEDEHLSLPEAEALEISGPDGDYNPYGYPGAYWQVQQHFPDAIKVFEVKPQLAIENYEAVLAGRPL